MSGTSQHNFSRNFVCVEYPGVVENHDNALKTLGGIRNLSDTYSNVNRKLELRFRPDDVFCKPAYGTRDKTTGLLLKIKVTKRKSESGEEINCEPTVLGVVRTVYRFTDPCDFQFLPLHQDLGLDILNPMSILSKGLPTSDWVNVESPLFLVPSTFSRIDTIQDFCYQKNTKENEILTPNLIGSSRPHRLDHSIFIYFDSRDIPTRPTESVDHLHESNTLLANHYKTVKKLFEERPIWSKNAASFLTQFSLDQLKCLLPMVAYYFVSGPWRTMWVKFGYDPRKDPDSRIYQTLDFRLRSLGGLKKCIKAKRSVTSKIVPHKLTVSRPVERTLTDTGDDDDDTKQHKSKENIRNFYNEDCYLYRPGMVPPARQMFYQYCDIHIAEIQAMLSKLPCPDPSIVCHPKYGWMPPGLDEQCREIIMNYVKVALRTQTSNEAQLKKPSPDNVEFIKREESLLPASGEEELRFQVSDDYAQPSTSKSSSSLYPFSMLDDLQLSNSSSGSSSSSGSDNED